MVSIQRVLAQIKDDWTHCLSESHLTRICRETGARWRCRPLTPVVTIYVFLLQVLHGNTAMTNLAAPVRYHADRASTIDMLKRFNDEPEKWLGRIALAEKDKDGNAADVSKGNDDVGKDEAQPQ